MRDFDWYCPHCENYFYGEELPGTLDDERNGGGGMKRGTQIVYVPKHANGNIFHDDVETGFVTKISGDYAFCRYWSKVNPGELRTKSNSEMTPLCRLEEIEIVAQWRVNELLEDLP